MSSAPTVTVQGSRPFMLEVQALCAERDDPEGGAAGGGQQIPAVRTAVGRVDITPIPGVRLLTRTVLAHHFN